MHSYFCCRCSWNIATFAGFAECPVTKRRMFSNDLLQDAKWKLHSMHWWEYFSVLKIKVAKLSPLQRASDLHNYFAAAQPFTKHSVFLFKISPDYTFFLTIFDLTYFHSQKLCTSFSCYYVKRGEQRFALRDMFRCCAEVAKVISGIK